MNSATVPYKVSVRLGQAEFSAEGPEGTVREQLASFLEIASAQSQNAVPKEKVNHLNGNGHAGQSDENGQSNGDGKHIEMPPLAALPGDWQQWIKTTNAGRLFAVDDKNGVVSVRILPRTESREADTLLMILFGYLAFKGDSEVKASLLLRAAKQSGIVNLSRIDTILDKHAALVRRGGFKRGSWYALTNPGITHAEKLARECFT